MSDQAAESSLRLFVALELPPEWRRALADLQRTQERLAPGYFRWVQPELMHLTLVFLGQEPADLLDTLSGVVTRAAARIEPFRWSLGEVGAFGSPRSPRVLWVAAHQPESRLQQLRDALEFELRAVNIVFDAKPLVPHITLGRARERRPRPVRLLETPKVTGGKLADRIVLFQSHLSPRGPRYEARAVAALGGPGRCSGPLRNSRG